MHAAGRWRGRGCRGEEGARKGWERLHSLVWVKGETACARRPQATSRLSTSNIQIAKWQTEYRLEMISREQVGSALPLLKAHPSAGQIHKEERRGVGWRGEGGGRGVCMPVARRSGRRTDGWVWRL
jgi:hypothetical protein